MLRYQADPLMTEDNYCSESAQTSHMTPKESTGRLVFGLDLTLNEDNGHYTQQVSEQKLQLQTSTEKSATQLFPPQNIFSHREAEQTVSECNKKGQPVLLSHSILAYFSILYRDYERFRIALLNIDFICLCFI